MELLKFAVQLWEWVSLLNEEKLGKCIVWEPDEVSFRCGMVKNEFVLEPDSKRFYNRFKAAALEGFHTHSFGGSIATREKHPDLLSRWKEGDLLGPAKMYLASTINRQLSGQVSSLLKLPPGPGDRVHLVEIDWPQTLHAALWYQLYQCVIGKRTIRRCVICGKRMDITGHRRSKRMHSSCSMRERNKGRAGISVEVSTLT